MPYSGVMPTMEAIQQAVREPLSRAPHDHNGFAIYIFERAREIDHERALAKTLAAQTGHGRETSNTPQRVPTGTDAPSTAQ